MKELIGFPLNKLLNSEVRSGEKFFKCGTYILNYILENEEFALNEININDLSNLLDIKNAKNKKLNLNRYMRMLKKFEIIKGDNSNIKLNYQIQENILNCEMKKNDIIMENLINLMLHKLDGVGILEIIYKLINDPQIKKLSRIEIALIAYYAKEAEEDLIDLKLRDMKIIIKEYKKNKKKNKYKQLFNTRDFKNQKDYADTLINYLEETECFLVNKHSGKTIKINKINESRILFFIKSTYEERENWLNDKTFNERLYSCKGVNIIKKTSKTKTKELVEDYTKVKKALNKNYKKRFESWYEYECANSFLLIKTVFENDSNAKKYKRKVAISTEDGLPSESSSPGVSDCLIVFDDIIISQESTLLTSNRDQMVREYYQIQEHIKKELLNHGLKKGIVIFTAPKISEELMININLQNNEREKEISVIIPLKSGEYELFLKKYNNSESFKILYEKLMKIKDENGFTDEVYANL